MLNSLDDGLLVRLDLSERLIAQDALELSGALVLQIRQEPGYGDAVVVVKGMGEGTWWIHLLIIAGAIATIADRAPKLIDDIKAGEGPFGTLVAPTLDRHKGSTCQVVTSEIDRIIGRERWRRGW